MTHPNEAGNTPDDGGPAFPVSEEAARGKVAAVYGGMSLRDHYAGLAMQGILANHNACPDRQEHFDNIAVDAIRMADAMIRARATGSPQ